jgi:hypothetical protein
MVERADMLNPAVVRSVKAHSMIQSLGSKMLRDPLDFSENRRG